jgi:hypothetical protein
VDGLGMKPGVLRSASAIVTPVLTAPNLHGRALSSQRGVPQVRFI